MVNEVAYNCDLCRDKFSKIREGSKVYCRISSLESSFVCAECSTPFSMGYEVTDKDSIADEDSDFPLEGIKCDEEFIHREEKSNCLNTPPRLRKIRHSTSKNKDFHDQQNKMNIKTFKCKHCDKSFLHESRLKRHLPKHSKERLYSCNSCTSTFKRRDALIGHENVHKDTYKCEICNKCFHSGKELQIHRKVHSIVKPHKCSYCHKSYKTPQALKLHANLHKKNNPFVCELCKKNCVSKFDLRQHRVKHTDDRPHQCNICSYAAKRETDLESHMKKHNKD